ncbi:MAG: hypothetical protein K2M19_03620 [Muribaculaceae bacterium]|nr:hypothetical protein [Muribaculaceae bacterium]
MRRLWVILSACAIALQGAGADPIVGRWNLSGGEAVVDIKLTDSPDRFEMIWVDGADCSVLPGTPVGSISATPTPGLYDCRMPIDPTGSSKPQTWEATIRIDENDPYSFTFKHYERRTAVSVRNILPRWLRISVTRKDTRPDNLEGARRADAPPRFIRL